jgi:uncharacterized Fe-S cluster-containing radical SAM superfamily protein
MSGIHSAEQQETEQTSAPKNGASRYDPDLLNAIERTGFHPFIMVRVVGEGGEPRVIVCETQNEVGQFVNLLAELPEFKDSKLLRGIERALQLEVYEASDLLFSWVREPGEYLSEGVHIGLPVNYQLRNFFQNGTFCNYPAFSLAHGIVADSEQQRAQCLVELFDAYSKTQGNDALRIAILEAMALAIARSLGHLGQFGEAFAIVDSAFALIQHSIHLKAAKHTLGLRLDGKKVPLRLEKFVGEDNGYLDQFVCPLPFERFDIGPDGGVMVCCGHWLPTSIGNFMTDPIEGVLNSERAQSIRKSVTDGSYRYCNHLDCGAMIQDSLPTRDQLKTPRTREAVARGNYHLDGVSQLMFAFDQSCNLSCPSCRTQLITEKASESTQKAKAVEEKLLPMLPTLRVLNINPAGELFASKPSRKLLEMIDDELCPNLKLDIISNGTLFTEDEWNKFPGIHNRVRSVRISIDAATKETFEKLRRLGKYGPFVENMRFLKGLRSDRVIQELKFSFTYQLDNFREMHDFVAFCDEMNADFAVFERLQNIAFSCDEFRRKAVHLPDHPHYEEFIEVIKDPAFRASSVWHDFDYDGVEKMSGEEARARIRDIEEATTL